MRTRVNLSFSDSQFRNQACKVLTPLGGFLYERVLRFLLNTGVTLNLLLTSLVGGWQLNAIFHYGYPFWYEVYHIQATIAQSAPLNRHHKENFVRTNQREHERLFAVMVHSIHHGGEGLSAIEYQDPEGRVIGSLLEPAEIAHLQDVAHLIGKAQSIAWVSLFLSLLLFLLIAMGRYRLPSPKRLAGGVGLLMLAAWGFLEWGGPEARGPRAVFYQFHAWIFPHPWFFYYEDSLMTTLMKAPSLFAGIAISIGSSGLVIFSMLVWLANRIKK